MAGRDNHAAAQGFWKFAKQFSTSIFQELFSNIIFFIEDINSFHKVLTKLLVVTRLKILILKIDDQMVRIPQLSS